MPAPPGYSTNARHQVQEILKGPPYTTTPSHPPRPFAGVLHAIGRALDRAFGGIARWLYDHVLLHLGHGFTATFGSWWPAAVGVLALAAGALVALLVARRRTRLPGRSVTTGMPVGSAEDPEDLEARAEAAERAGDHTAAVRLRFRAGLLRLDRRGIVANADARTDGQLSDVLGSPTFDALAQRHEVIVYGGDPATPADATSARTEWPRVLVEAARDPS